MAALTKTELKKLFKKGEYITEPKIINLIDSLSFDSETLKIEGDQNILDTKTFEHIISQDVIISDLSFDGVNQLGLDIDGEASGDSSGWSVSINALGDRVAIGAPNNDGNRGHTRIYEWNGTSWNQLGLDIDGEASGDWSGYSVSINALGDRVAIGAYLNDGNGSNSGHTRIYGWNGASWVQLGSDINGEATLDSSGYSVSINAIGDRVAIGAITNDGNGTDSGHTRIYEWNGASWIKLGSDIDGEATLDRSGYSVSINAIGDRVAIGAPYNDGSGTGRGHTRIYEWNGASWVQLGLDIDGEADNDRSGWSVSINALGDRVAIGANSNDGNGTDSGHTRIYEWNGASWVQLGLDIDGEASYDSSGYSVSINALGDRVAIGARNNDGNGSNSGHTRIYGWNGASWNQSVIDIDGEASYDRSGYSVSINAIGDRVAIGANINAGNGTGAGHTRIYRITSNKILQIDKDGQISENDHLTDYENPHRVTASQVGAYTKAESDALSSKYSSSFAEADLTTGVISFAHNLNNQFNIVQVYDELNQIVLPDEITATDANNVEIDLTSFSPITGTWNIVVI